VKKAKAVIAISRFIENKIKLYKKENVFYIPNGVDISLFKPTKHPFKKTLLTVCGISSQKGLIFLVKALREVAKIHKDFRWIHVGTIPTEGDENFPYYLQLIKLIKKYSISRYVNFLGRVPLGELIKFYQTSDIFVLPSLWEGMPLVVLEAMSCGLPIISTKISGIEDLVINNFNGILVEPGNVKALSNAILQLLGDENLVRNMGKNSRKRVEKEFSWEIIARKVKTVYERIS
jgi:glycosyltransferase involved in cell wall biosynthesis